MQCVHSKECVCGDADPEKASNDDITVKIYQMVVIEAWCTETRVIMCDDGMYRQIGWTEGRYCEMKIVVLLKQFCVIYLYISIYRYMHSCSVTPT